MTFARINFFLCVYSSVLLDNIIKRALIFHTAMQKPRILDELIDFFPDFAAAAFIYCTLEE